VQVRYNLGTAKLSQNYGTTGRAILILLGVVLAVGGILSLWARSIVPIGLAVVACLLVMLRRVLMPGRSGVIGSRSMGSITIGVQGIAVANVQGRTNVFSWQEIEAIGVLQWKDNIAFRSRSPRIAQLLPPMRPGVPVYLPISIAYIEAPRETVIAALQYYAGGRFVGAGLAKEALGG
jgi:hypothetical protein